jgi:hypothetical protein
MNEAPTSQEKQDVFAEKTISPGKAMWKEPAPIPQDTGPKTGAEKINIKMGVGQPTRPKTFCQGLP